MNEQATDIEFLWWSGCPSWEQALKVLHTEVAKAGLDPESIVVTEVATHAEVSDFEFVGSPTIRVRGKDIQDPGDEAGGLTCRVYRHRDGRISPLPDPADVIEALEPLRKVPSDG